MVGELAGSRCVDGLTILEGHLFILCGTRLSIYGCPQDLTQRAPDSGYNLLRHIDVNQLDKHCWNDLASCEQSRSLFISDHRHKCVHSLAFPTDTEVFTKLADVPNKPHGLSVTHNLTLLLACRDDHMLMEIDSQSGRLLRQIELPADIDCPYHAAQLTTGQYVVCYGTTGSGHHGVSVVDCCGAMECSYRQLHYPSHVNIDENHECIYVSDHYQHRVVRLNFSLEFLGGISVGTSDWPWRLCLDHASRRLFAGLDKGSVRILQLS